MNIFIDGVLREATPEEEAEILEAQAASQPQPQDPLSLPLARLTFWLAAAEIGVYKPLVRANIDAMPEGPEKYEAIVWFEEATVYRRNDPLLIQLAAAEGITEPQLDALWVWAQGNPV